MEGVLYESIDSSEETSRLRKILAKESNPPSYLKRNDGTWAETLEEISSILIDAHFPESRAVGQDEQEDVTLEGTPANIVEKIVTKRGIRWAVGTFKPYKSAGLDSIFPALIQQSLDDILPELREIFRSSLRFGYIPRSWREVKESSFSHSLAKDYRSISLSSF